MITQFNQSNSGQGGRFGGAQPQNPGMPPHWQSNAMPPMPPKLEILLPPRRPRDFRHPKDKFIAGLLMSMAPAWGYFYLGDALKGWGFLGAQFAILLFIISSILALSTIAVVFWAFYAVVNLFGFLQAILIWSMSLERWDRTYGIRI